MIQDLYKFKMEASIFHIIATKLVSNCQSTQIVQNKGMYAHMCFGEIVDLL